MIRIAVVAVVCLFAATYATNAGQDCKKNQDCRGDKYVCDRSTKKCIEVECTKDSHCGNGKCKNRGKPNAGCGCTIAANPSDCKDNEDCWSSIGEHGFCMPEHVGTCGYTNLDINPAWGGHMQVSFPYKHQNPDSNDRGCINCNEIDHIKDEWAVQCITDSCEIAHNAFCNSECDPEDSEKCGECEWDNNNKRCVEPGRGNMDGEYCQEHPNHPMC